MRLELCLCAEIPHLPLRTKVIVISTKRELQIPTNTARLAAQALPNSCLLRRGEVDEPYDLAAHIAPNSCALLLYPAADAVPLSAAFVAGLGQDISLVVPDGNWRQTAKLRRRDPVAATLLAVTLPDTLGPSGYAVRHEAKAGGLATIEAIARALGVIEGPAVQAALEAVFMTMVRRTMASRGRPLSEVNDRTATTSLPHP